VETEENTGGGGVGVTFALTMQMLLESHYALVADLPLFLLQLGSGESLNIGAVPEDSLREGLREFFLSLSAFGVEEKERYDFKWGMARKGDDYALLRIVDSVLDDVGLTLGAVAEVEMEERQIASKKEREERERAEKEGKVERAKGILLKMIVENGKELGEELKGMMDMVMDGEVVVLGGIEDEKMRGSLEGLLVCAGLVEGETDEGEKGLVLGGGSTGSEAKVAVMELINVCDHPDPEAGLAHLRGGGGAGPSRGPARGPANDPAKVPARGPVKGPARGFPNGGDGDSSDDDDYGVSKTGTGNTLSLDEVKSMAAQRNHDMLVAKGLAAPNSEVGGGGREEWMMVPGEHNFLDGLKATEIIKSRGFKNEKGGNKEVEAEKIDPEVQRQMEELQREHDEIRGPSLMDLHRDKKQQEKEEKAKAKGEKWGWSRKDLDSGRRVDKNNLKNLMNGKEGLRDKFQGSITKF